MSDGDLDRLRTDYDDTDREDNETRRRSVYTASEIKHGKRGDDREDARLLLTLLIMAVGLILATVGAQILRWLL